MGLDITLFHQWSLSPISVVRLVCPIMQRHSRVDSSL